VKSPISMESTGGLLGNRWLALGLLVLFVPLAWRAWSKVSEAQASASASPSRQAHAPDATAAAIPAAPAPAPAKPSDADLRTLAEQDARLALPIAVDPFRADAPAPVAKAEAPPNLRLEALSACAGKRLAVIEDRVLAVGEEIDGFRIDAIDASRVTLRRGDRTFVLELASASPDGSR
jgi:hypothetical protein